MKLSLNVMSFLALLATPTMCDNYRTSLCHCATDNYQGFVFTLEYTSPKYGHYIARHSESYHPKDFIGFTPIPTHGPPKTCHPFPNNLTLCGDAWSMTVNGPTHRQPKDKRRWAGRDMDVASQDNKMCGITCRAHFMDAGDGYATAPYCNVEGEFPKCPILETSFKDMDLGPDFLAPAWNENEAGWKQIWEVTGDKQE